jgi:hypothetical protein
MKNDVGTRDGKFPKLLFSLQRSAVLVFFLAFFAILVFWGDAHFYVFEVNATLRK